MTIEVGLEVEVGQVPDLDFGIPAARDDDWVVGGWAELNSRHPFGMALVSAGSTLLDPLALAKSVPKSDRLIATATDDLSVVGTESDAHDVVLVALEDGAGDAALDIPETKGLVPRSRNGKSTARTDNDVAHKVAVAFEGSKRNAIRNILVRVLAGQLPDKKGLISRGRDKHIRVDWTAGDLSDPALVVFEGAPQRHDFGAHDSTGFLDCSRVFSVSST